MIARRPRRMFIPLFFWLPSIVSLAALGGLWFMGDLNPRPAFVLGAWFALAFGCQWFAREMTPAWAAGLALQALLAVVLVTWWKVVS